MFRIKICYQIKDGCIRARLNSNGAYKNVHIDSSKHYISNNREHWREFLCQLEKTCRELIRDLLFNKYGVNWRKYEQIDLVLSSSKSAVKRMKPAEISKH